MLHFIKIVAPLTVFVTINSTLSHIYRDICSESTHCYNTTQWYWAARVGVYGVARGYFHTMQKKTKQKTSRCLFFCVFLLSVENYLQFGSMATAQKWKAVSCAKAEQKYAHFCVFVSASNRSLQKKRAEWYSMWAALATFSLTNVKFRFGACLFVCDIVLAHRQQVNEGLSRLCLADDFLRHNNSHPKTPVCVRLCFKVRLLIPCVIMDHNGKQNDLSPFIL